MSTNRRNCLLTIVGALAHGLASGAVFPAKEVTIVSGFPPGATDFIRTVAERLTSMLGKPFILDIQTGASGTIAAERVARAPADGHTLLLGAGVNLSYAELLETIRFNPITDFIPIAPVAFAPNVIVVNASSRIGSLAELAAEAKGSDGKLTYASSGNGGSGHVAVELWKSKTGVKMGHAPYRGHGPAAIDVAGGHVPLGVISLPSALPLLKAGRLRAIATTSAKRPAALSGVPTVSEQGFPGFDVVTWWGLVAPRNTDAAVISTLNAALVKILNSDDIGNAFVQLGIEPMVMSPAEFRAFIASDRAFWTKTVRDLGLKLN